MNKKNFHIPLIIFVFFIFNANSTFSHDREQHLKNERDSKGSNSKIHEEGSGFKSYLKNHWNYNGHDNHKSNESFSKNLEEGSGSSTKEKSPDYDKSHGSYESKKRTSSHQKEGSSNH